MHSDPLCRRKQPQTVSKEDTLPPVGSRRASRRRLLEGFVAAGIPSARVIAEWSELAANEEAEEQRAINLARDLRRLARDYSLPVTALTRKGVVYLVRKETSKGHTNGPTI